MFFGVFYNPSIFQWKVPASCPDRLVTGTQCFIFVFHSQHKVLRLRIEFDVVLQLSTNYIGQEKSRSEAAVSSMKKSATYATSVALLQLPYVRRSIELRLCQVKEGENGLNSGKSVHKPPRPKGGPGASFRGRVGHRRPINPLAFSIRYAFQRRLPINVDNLRVLRLIFKPFFKHKTPPRAGVCFKDESLGRSPEGDRARSPISRASFPSEVAQWCGLLPPSRRGQTLGRMPKKAPQRSR